MGYHASGLTNPSKTRTYSEPKVSLKHGQCQHVGQCPSPPSSPSGIEVLEIRITWVDVNDGHGKYLFSSDAGWSTLDELFTSQRFVSLRKVVLWLELHMVEGGRPPHILELERNLTLPHVNGLFPSFRASNTQRTLEIHLKAVNCWAAPT